MFAEKGARVSFQTNDGGIHSSGISDRSCGCYEMQGCSAYLPIGAGGLPPQPCPDVRDHGIRGGWGGMRIRFIAS